MKTRAIGLAVVAAGALLVFGAVSDDRVDDRFDPHSAAYMAMRDAAFARAGLPVSTQCSWGHPSNDCMILDHLIPLCLMRLLPQRSEENEPENLQVQPCSYWSGFKCEAGPDADKDKLEREACADVRAGRVTPEAAAARPEFKREWP